MGWGGEAGVRRSFASEPRPLTKKTPGSNDDSYRVCEHRYLDTIKKIAPFSGRLDFAVFFKKNPKLISSHLSLKIDHQTNMQLLFSSLAFPSVPLSLLLLNGTHQLLVLEHERHGHEDKVEEEHAEAQAPVHLPVEAGDGHDDEDQHHEEDGDRAHHADGVDLHRLPVDDGV